MVTSLSEKVCDINVGFSVFDQISIKQSLNLDHLRCKSPDMIRREFWTILPAYNMDQPNLIAQKRMQPLTAGKPMI